MDCGPEELVTRGRNVGGRSLYHRLDAHAAATFFFVRLFQGSQEPWTHRKTRVRQGRLETMLIRHGMASGCGGARTASEGV